MGHRAPARQTLARRLALDAVTLFRRELLAFTAALTGHADVQYIWDDLTGQAGIFTYETTVGHQEAAFITNYERFNIFEIKRFLRWEAAEGNVEDGPSRV